MKPVFVCGCDRSGTTMLGAMLGTSSHSVVTPESQFLIEVVAPFSLTKKLSENEVAKLGESISTHWRYKLWRVQRDWKSIVASAKDGPTSADIIQSFVQEYAAQNDKENAEFWIDHTPLSINRVATLLELFPEARFIHLVRDGRAVAASVLPLDWGPHTILDAAQFWAWRVSVGTAAETAFGPDVIKRVKYEDVVLNPQENLRSICEFLELEYCESMISGKGFVLPSYTIHQHSLVGSPPDQSRLERWKQNFTLREIEIFEYLTGDLLQYFDYKMMYGYAARPLSTWERWSNKLQTFFLKWSKLLRRMAYVYREKLAQR